MSDFYSILGFPSLLKVSSTSGIVWKASKESKIKEGFGLEFFFTSFILIGSYSN
jgi:hypothetical protein